MIIYEFYLLKRKELLLLCLHNARGDVVAAEPLPELDPGESLAVLNWVGLPPVQSCPSQLSCCVQDMLPIIALGDVQLSLHCTEPVVCLEWVRRMGEHRWVTPQKLCTPVAGLRWWRRRRLRVSLLKCLNSIVQGGHHLHLELEVLLRGQGWRHRYPGTLVVLALGCSAPAASQNHTWCSPSDLNKRCMSKDIEEIIQTDMITFCKKDLGMIK